MLSNFSSNTREALPLPGLHSFCLCDQPVLSLQGALGGASGLAKTCIIPQIDVISNGCSALTFGTLGKSCTSSAFSSSARQVSECLTFQVVSMTGIVHIKLLAQCLLHIIRSYFYHLQIKPRWMKDLILLKNRKQILENVFMMLKMRRVYL